VSGKHAVLSPSASGRWVPCPGSAVLAPDGGKTSKAAAEGTMMHGLAEAALTGEDIQDRLGDVCTIEGFEFEVTQDILDDVMLYVNEARDAIGDDQYAVEVKVPLGHITGESGATGTADLVIFRPGEVEVRDAKFGRGVEVEAQDNTQLIMYALGVLEQYGEVVEVSRVRCVVHQPRLAGPKEAIYMLDELRAWAEQLKHASRRVTEAEQQRGKVSEALWFANFTKPTNAGCKFCPAKATCPTLAGEVMASVAADFEDLTNADAEELGKDFARIERVEAWCKAVRAEAERRLLQGKPVPGLKLVAGRRSPKRWIDENEAEQYLAKLIGDSRWERSLLSPTKAAKIVGKGADFGHLTTSNEGKPSVAFATDKRPEYTGTLTADDFDNLTESED
jgi:hypothetical protein